MLIVTEMIMLQSFWRGGVGGNSLGRKGAEGLQEQEKRGQKAEFLRWQEAGEIGEIMKHKAIFYNRRYAKRSRENNKNRVGTGI